MFIRSERLFLRPGWPEDSRELLGWVERDPAAREFCGAPWPRPSDYAAVDHAALDRAPEDDVGDAGRAQNRLLPCFLVTVPGAAGARLVGSVGLYRLGDDVHLGCWIAQDHRGRGYASEAVRAVLSLARTLGHARIMAGRLAENAAAGRVLEKTGFRCTGRLLERVGMAESSPRPMQEYELVFDSPSDCDGADKPVRQHAA